MPFWWKRRRKPWFGRWRYRRYRNKRRRFPKRRKRRPRYATRRRRRRRKYKVRRKKQKLPLVQWQPDSIRKCKIRGFNSLILGAEGTQMYCYTTNKSDYVPPRVPWGGGFAIECYTLKYLYEEYVFHQNIWTQTNILKDLCRFLYCKIELYRHPDTDFIVAYSRQGPFDLTKFTFPGCHPQQLLLEKHKKIVFSKSSKPNGRYRVLLKIKPPKLMLSKWFFTKEFCTKVLFSIKAAAMNLRYSFLSATNENMLVTIYSLNTAFYKQPDWGQAFTGEGYKPYSTLKLPIYYKVKKNNTDKTETIPSNAGSTMPKEEALSYDKGWFNPGFLTSKQIAQDAQFSPTAIHQAFVARYNPNIDTGEKNEIYCVAITNHNWAPPGTDKLISMYGMPLWLGLFGFISFLKRTKGESFLDLHVIVIKSPAIHCLPEIGGCDLYVPIDWDYMSGKKPYDQTITTREKANWYPTINWQLKTLNAIVETGPFVPQYSEQTNSTWELKLGYQFYFKWGGPHTGDPEITNPENLQTYDVPDKLNTRLQIANPEKISTESILHPWDWRRGFVKESALKRMYDNFETDTEFQCPTEQPQKKKKRLGALPMFYQEETQEVQSCLHYLSEKDICQETKETDLQQLIQQQQQQQQQLKRSILKLLMDLKNKQKMLQLHTGMLE
nr:MAG: ORF1 [Torque teno midi virus]